MTILDVPGGEAASLANDARKLRPEPLKVFPACGVEVHGQSLVPIFRISRNRWRVDEVRNAAIAVHQTPRERDDELGRNADRSERQALAGGESNRAKPFVEPRVRKLSREDDPIR